MVEVLVTTDEVIDAIERERARLLAAVDALGERATSVAVTEEGWTAKDVLAHLIHWSTQVAYGVGARVAPPVYMMEERKRRQAAGLSDAMPTGDESNALAVAYFARMSLADVRAEFERLADAIVMQLRERSDEEVNRVGAIPWAPGRPLWEVVGGDTFLHWPVHTEMIELAVRR
jgi:hypothetical protein